jgi:thioredoxin 1
MNRISDSSFGREVLAAAAPVLVTFISDDCAPCRGLLATLDQLAHETEDRFKFVAIDVVHNPESRALYNIHGLPTLAIFADGAIVARRVGASTDRQDISEWIAASIERR